MQIKPSQILQVAEEIVRIGGEQALKYHLGELAVDWKIDSSFVTRADLEIEKNIIKNIHTHYPNHHIYGEELGGNMSNNKPTWIIDPIEGTTNFIHGITAYGTQVAVAYQQQIIASALYEPISKKLISASIQQPTQINNRVTTLETQAISESTLLIEGGKRSDNFRQFLRKIDVSSFRSIRRLGSIVTDALFLTHHAYNIYMGFDMKLYDIAPVSLILKQAGYTTMDEQGRPWKPKSISHFIACHQDQADQVRELVSSIIITRKNI